MNNTIYGNTKVKRHIKYAVEQDLPVLIVGETGTGKTTIVKDIAEKSNQQWIRFNLTGETTVDEFLGKYVLEDKQTKWEDGVLLNAMKNGHWLIVDEINVALPEILFVLHSLLDDEKAVMVANHNGEVVKPHKNFRFFGTMNPVDEYAGTKDLNKAFKSRFGMILEMSYPPAKTEAKILHEKTGIDKDLASRLVDVGISTRKAKKDNQVFYTCSTRDLLQWANLVDALGVDDAFEVAVLNKANGDRDTMVKLYKEVFKTYEEAEKQGFKTNYDYYREEQQKLEERELEFKKRKNTIRKEIKEEIIRVLEGKEEDNVIETMTETLKQASEALA